MSTQSQTLAQWVTELNDALFIQPNDDVALKAVNEQIDPSLVVKINHNVYTYDQFIPGLQYVRSASTSTQDTFSVILQWENAEKPDGVVAVLSKWTNTDKATGKETKKTNVILWEVKWIDGKSASSGPDITDVTTSHDGAFATAIASGSQEQVDTDIAMGNGSISTTPSHDTSTTGDAELENEILRSFGLAISKLPFGSSASPASGPSGSVTTSLGTEESSSPLKNLKWFTHLSTWKIAYHYQPPKELPPPQAFSDYTRGLQSWLRRFQREGHNPFIHRHLYPTRAIPDSIQDAYAVIAVSEGSCPENENMVDHIATSLVTRLLSSQSQKEGQTLHLANTLDHLARTQALLIHLLLALFSPSISRQAKAESLIETLHRWKLALWESASQEANLAELFPYLHTMPLEGERSDVDSIPGLHRAFIMCESVRRTWLVCSMTTGVYRALRGDWTAACGGDVRFTARAGLWDASSPARWAVLAGKADPLFNYSLLGDQLANCEILESDVDEFALHIFALMWGSDKVESWFIQT